VEFFHNKEIKIMKITTIIPAHLDSVRFPRKILYEFHGLPMIEHVRRRALLSKEIHDVSVATCDDEIADTIRGYGGKVIMTSNNHTSGTARVAEAVESIDCTHVILLQGDEPLLLPRHIDSFVQAIKDQTDGDAWNATGPIENPNELDRHSFVKCMVAKSGIILYCFRRTPFYCDFEEQQVFVKKILGIIAFRKSFLLKLIKLPASIVEEVELIEQMRIIENGFKLFSVSLSSSLPSVNEPKESQIVLDYINKHVEQQRLIERILV